MSTENVKDMSNQGAEVAFSMEDFHNKSHFWGRLTLLLVIIASVTLPIYLSFVMGAHPGWGPIVSGLIGYAAFIGIMWVIEPITYFPVLGVAGTYIAFLSGNIANLCLPSSSAAQKTVGADPGTEKAEVAGVLGIAIASLTNTIIILLTVLGGAYVIDLVPENIRGAFDFVLPAIFGAVLGQFAFKTPLYGLFALVTGLLVFFSPIPDLLKIASCVVIAIVGIYNMEKFREKKSNS